MDPVFVLTLADARQRQSQVRRWAAACGLDDRMFVEGVDLRSDPAGFEAPAAGEQRRRQRYGSARLTPPEYGCALGHRRIWSLIEAEGLAWALVLEDDAVPTADNWLQTARALADQLQASLLGSRPWVVHLAVDPHRRRSLALRPLRWLNPCESACPAVGEVDGRLGSLWTTTAYLISRTATRRLLDDERVLPCVADDWELRLRRRTVDPLLATRAPLFDAGAAFGSQIPCRSDPTPAPVNRPRRKLLTLAYRSGLMARSY